MKVNFWILLFVLCAIPGVIAQESGRVISLKEHLKQLAIKYEVTFNYIEDDVSKIEITLPEKSKSLDEALQYIESKTGLRLNLISNNQVVISKAISNTNNVIKICGYLYDSQTLAPIEFATVDAVNQNQFTTTNNLGYFELSVPENQTVRIRHLGFSTLKFTSKNIENDCPKIYLTPENFLLDEVIAQTYLTRGIRKKTDGTVEIKPKSFGLLPGLVEPDVLQTMQQIPGVMSVDETVSNINVRGGTHDQNLFLWNGMRLFQTGHFFGLISALNPNLPHTISISKNGSSAFYEGGISSVIDISTLGTQPEKSSSTVGINMLNVDVYHQSKLNNTSSIEFSARRSFTDLLKSPTYKNYFNRIFQNTEIIDLETNTSQEVQTVEDFYFYDASLQYQSEIGNRHLFSISSILISNELLFEENLSIENQVNTKKNNLTQRTLGGSINWLTRWNENHTTELNFFVSQYQLEALNESIFNAQILNQENSILDSGIKIKHSLNFQEGLQWNSGFHMHEIGITNYDKINIPLFERKTKNVLLSHSMIQELKYRSKNEKLASTTGVRMNYFPKWDLLLFEPRFSINYNISVPLSIQLLAEQKNQTFSQIIDLQQDFFGVEKRRWVLSNNDDIPIQKSTQASVGLTWSKNNWLIQGEGFYKQVDGITSSGQGFQNQLEFIKVVGAYEVIGFEAFIQKKLKQFLGWLSYSFNDNTYTFKGYIPPQFANNFEVNHNINFGSTYQWKNLKFSLGGRYFTGRPNTIPLQNTPIFIAPGNAEIAYGIPNEQNLDDYLQLNSSFSYTVALTDRTSLMFGASVLNISNRANPLNRFYRINENQQSIEEVNTFSLKRTYNCFLRVNF